jgi:hypothetical protein
VQESESGSAGVDPENSTVAVGPAAKGYSKEHGAGEYQVNVRQVEAMLISPCLHTIYVGAAT